jgi:hypothetical protein
MTVLDEVFAVEGCVIFSLVNFTNEMTSDLMDDIYYSERFLYESKQKSRANFGCLTHDTTLLEPVGAFSLPPTLLSSDGDQPDCFASFQPSFSSLSSLQSLLGVKTYHFTEKLNSVQILNTQKLTKKKKNGYIKQINSITGNWTSRLHFRKKSDSATTKFGKLKEFLQQEIFR